MESIFLCKQKIILYINIVLQIMRKPVILLGIGVLILVFSQVNALEVKPSWAEFNGNFNDWVVKNISIVNDENKTINVTIQPSSAISDCYISRPALTLAPHESENITLGIQLTHATHGFILYTYDNQQINQFILLTPNEKNVSIDMIPASPPPGGTVVFLLNPYNVNGVGFVYVVNTNRIYNFTIVNGMAFVSLSPHDYGEAVAILQGQNFQARKIFTISGNEVLSIEAPSLANVGENATIYVKYNGAIVNAVVNVTRPDGSSYEKTTGNLPITFDTAGKWIINATYMGASASASIDVSSHGTLSIVTPSSASVGDEKWITLLIGANPVKNCNVMVQLPDGSMKPYKTNDYGQFQIKFTSAGTYHFIASYNGITATQELDVEKKNINITAPEYGFVGNTITINAPAGASIKISGGGKEINGMVTDGGYSFTPVKAGVYNVFVETDEGKGNAVINIYEKPLIQVFNSRHLPVNSGVAGKQYSIYVMSNSGDTVPLSHVTITDESGVKYIITMNDGCGVWTPENAGRYTIQTPQQGMYYQASKYITISPQSGGGGWIYGGIIAVLIAIVIVVKYRDKIMDKIKKKEEEKEEEERKSVE